MKPQLDYHRPPKMNNRMYFWLRMGLAILAFLGILMILRAQWTLDGTLEWMGRAFFAASACFLFVVSVIQRMHEKRVETEEDYEREYRERQRVRQDEETIY